MRHQHVDSNVNLDLAAAIENLPSFRSENLHILGSLDRVGIVEHEKDVYQYSRLKLGCSLAERCYVEQLTSFLREKLSTVQREELSTCWSIATSGAHRGYGLPNAASLLGRGCALRLGMHHTLIPRMNNPSAAPFRNYESVGTTEGRRDLIEQEFAEVAVPEVQNRNVILIDDCVVSGAFLSVVSRLLLASGALDVKQVVLFSFDGGASHAVEHMINTFALEKDKHQVIIDLLRDSETTLVTRLVNYTCALPSNQISEVLHAIPEASRLNLLLAAVTYFGSDISTSVLKQIMDSISFTEEGQRVFEKVMHLPGDGSSRWAGNILGRQFYRNTADAHDLLVALRG